MHLFSGGRRNTTLGSSKHKISRNLGQSKADETDDVSELLGRMEEVRTYSLELTQRLHKQVKVACAASDEGKKMADTLTVLQSKVMKQQRDGHLVECLTKARDFHINLQDLESRKMTAMENKIATKIADWVKDEGIVSKNARKNFSKAKSTYESLAQQVKKEKTKKPQLEQELAQAKEEYATIGNLTMNLLTDSDAEFDILILRAMCDYWDSYTEYFTKGYKWVTNMAPIVERYREHVDLEEEDMKKKKLDERSSNELFKVAGDSKVFGAPLQELCAREQRKTPKFLAATCSWIEKNATELEGIFRISSFKDTMEEYKQVIDSGATVDFTDVSDPHIVPGLLKLFLREMPEPLLTFKQYRGFIDVNSIEDDSKRFAALKSLLAKLPTENRACLKTLMNLLSTIADNQPITKMGATNLATVVGPNILYDKELDPMSMVEDMENANAVIVMIITSCEALFRTEDVIEAAKENDIKTMAMLHSKGQSYDKKDKDGNTCLHFAAKEGSFELTEFLLNEQVDINATNKAGLTPLMMTASHNEAQQMVAVLLINKGADALIRTSKGLTIFDLARKVSPDFAVTIEQEFAVVQSQTPSSKVDTLAELSVDESTAGGAPAIEPVDEPEPAAKAAPEPKVEAAQVVSQEAVADVEEVEPEPEPVAEAEAVAEVPPPAKVTPVASVGPVAEQKEARAVEEEIAPAVLTPGPPKATASDISPTSPKVDVKKPSTPTPTPGPPQEPATVEVTPSVVPETTAEQAKLTAAERAQQKAQEMLRSRMASKAPVAVPEKQSAPPSPARSTADGSPSTRPGKAAVTQTPLVSVPSPSSARLEAASQQAVDDIIFHKARSLNSLVKTNAPIQSVYSLVNVDEMSIACLSIVGAASLAADDKEGLQSLQNSLKLVAAALKGLFANVKKFASLFDLAEKKEVLSNALALQSTVRALIGIVKDVCTSPNDEVARAALRSNCQSFADTVYKFYRSCEIASTEHVVNATNQCGTSLAKMLGSEDAETLDKAAELSASACVKLMQLVKLRVALSSFSSIKDQLTASLLLVERTTLEVINEAKRSMVTEGSANTEETQTLAKKLAIEFKSIGNLIKREPAVAPLDKSEQAVLYQQLADRQQELLNRLRATTFAADLDKALVLQYQTLTVQMKKLAETMATASSAELVAIITKSIDALKKLRVGVNAIGTKSRDVTLKRQLTVLGEAVGNYCITLRLSMSIFVLNESNMQLPLFGRLQGVSAIASDFYENLLQLRSLA